MKLLFVKNLDFTEMIHLVSTMYDPVTEESFQYHIVAVGFDKALQFFGMLRGSPSQVAVVLQYPFIMDAAYSSCDRECEQKPRLLK